MHNFVSHIDYFGKSNRRHVGIKTKTKTSTFPGGGKKPSGSKP